MKRCICSIALILCALLPLSAQSEKKEVRRGNSDYKKENYKDSEIHYRKALVQDSTSFAATYDLANTLYQQRDYEGADNTLKKIEEEAQKSQHASKYYFNKGNTALQKQDYAAAVEDFKQSLLRNPADLQAKESYIYAKKMLDKQNQGGQDGEQNQQNQKQDEQEQDQNQQDQQQNQQDQQNQQAQEQQISAQQAQQMLKAIQAKEKETQEKVEKMKAEKAKSRQKEKNW